MSTKMNSEQNDSRPDSLLEWKLDEESKSFDTESSPRRKSESFVKTTNTSSEIGDESNQFVKSCSSDPSFRVITESSQEAILNPLQQQVNKPTDSTSLSSTVTAKKNQRRTSFDETIVSRSNSQSRVRQQQQQQQQHVHHHRVYSHHSTSPILPMTPDYGSFSSSSYLTEILPPQDVMHPLLGPGSINSNRTEQHVDGSLLSTATSTSILDESLQSITAHQDQSFQHDHKAPTTLNKMEKPPLMIPPTGSPSYPNINHGTSGAPFIISNVPSGKLFSTHSAPCSDNGQHQPLDHRYRSFSFDGKMFRNTAQQKNNENTNASRYQPPQSEEGDEENRKNLLRRSSFRGQFPRYDGISPPLQQKKHERFWGEDQEFLQPVRSRSYSHPKPSQDPNNHDELSGLLNRQQQNFQSDDNTYYTDQERMNSSRIYGHDPKKSESPKGGLFYNFVYALLNTMMSVPSLYGYASVIFNNPVFQPHIATLSKLVIWSSAIHQLSFVFISSISFAKAEVQDAGLLFLSCISQFIAESILSDQGTVEEVISTTIVALGVATASLGMMLMLMGRFNCANAVSYLPLPVVGGYLAFIGYFCVLAGVSLCISKSMIDGNIWSDMEILSDRHSLILALPGIVSGLVMMLVARYAQNDATLPFVMVVIPSLFYAVLYFTGLTLDDARQYKWIGEKTEASSLVTLLDVLDLNLVRWDLIFSRRCFTVWIGMVFVVSFSSCLDVAAISMDMGEPLNINKELVTVGLSNLFSGALLGQSGSYIFSTTILTYRTGFHSRWIGFLGSLMFLYFSLSKVNLLEIAPLYFLGSTLIFIGIDLLYEWLVEVSHKLLLSEYLVLLATFVAILLEGIDAGIVAGLIVAVVEYVVTSSQLPSLRRVFKRSRAVWEPQHRKLLQDIVYDSKNPKILSLEISETVFFGSSLQLFSQICDEIGLDTSPTDMNEIVVSSPGIHSNRTPPSIKKHRTTRSITLYRPRYVVLEMSQVANVDASAARSCFLQLAKICSKNGILLCACGTNGRVNWILRSHEVAYTNDEEEIIKAFMLDPQTNINIPIPTGKLILFSSINECLELCENQLLCEFKQSNLVKPPILGSRGSKPDLRSLSGKEGKTPLSEIFARVLGIESRDEKYLLESFDMGGSAEIDEIELSEGQKIFSEHEISDGFFVVLRGSITISRMEEQRQSGRPPTLSIRSDASSLSVGGIFGYVDFAIQRRRSFNAFCTTDGTIVAKISQASIDRLKREDMMLHHMIERVLLQASLIELANIDVS